MTVPDKIHRRMDKQRQRHRQRRPHQDKQERQHLYLSSKTPEWAGELGGHADPIPISSSPPRDSNGSERATATTTQASRSRSVHGTPRRHTLARRQSRRSGESTDTTRIRTTSRVSHGVGVRGASAGLTGYTSGQPLLTQGSQPPPQSRPIKRGWSTGWFHPSPDGRKITQPEREKDRYETSEVEETDQDEDTARGWYQQHEPQLPLETQLASQTQSFFKSRPQPPPQSRQSQAVSPTSRIEPPPQTRQLQTASPISRIQPLPQSRRSQTASSTSRIQPRPQSRQSQAASSASRVQPLSGTRRDRRSTSFIDSVEGEHNVPNNSDILSIGDELYMDEYNDTDSDQIIETEVEDQRHAIQEEDRIKTITNSIRVEEGVRAALEDPDPAFRFRRRWGTQELERLLELFERHGPQWETIRHADRRHIDGPHFHPSRTGVNLKDKIRNHKIALKKKRQNIPQSFNHIHLGEREMRTIARRRRFYTEFGEQRSVLPPIEEDDNMRLRVHPRLFRGSQPPAAIKREPIS